MRVREPAPQHGVEPQPPQPTRPALAPRPGSLANGDLLALQRAAGNRATNEHIQRALTDDIYETDLDADRAPGYGEELEAEEAPAPIDPSAEVERATASAAWSVAQAHLSIAGTQLSTVAGLLTGTVIPGLSSAMANPALAGFPHGLVLQGPLQVAETSLRVARSQLTSIPSSFWATDPVPAEQFATALLRRVDATLEMMEQWSALSVALIGPAGFPLAARLVGEVLPARAMLDVDVTTLRSVNGLPSSSSSAPPPAVAAPAPPAPAEPAPEAEELAAEVVAEEAPPELEDEFDDLLMPMNFGIGAAMVAANEHLEIERLRAEWSNRIPQRHSGTKQMRMSADEKDDSSAFTNMLIEHTEKLIPSKFPDFRTAMKLGMGWDDNDIDTLLAGGNRVADGATKVKYLDEEERKAYEVWGGNPLRYGLNGEVLDTKDMYSKFKGAAFAIFVMKKDGTMYAGTHKVGLFHHSSFLSGADVAGAGEMKVEGGRLVHITNKSGHYWPENEQMQQTLAELERRGVSLAGVGVTLMRPNGSVFQPAEDALTLLRQSRGQA
ncbi:MAG TPA: hypothetical protein VK866_00710 [Acidimicrobiales bacterium]|nr:hypothetical protein [Acidimicrobiales bacterium]